MTKKSQSKVSTVADCFRGCFDCQCRRRTFTNKILPAVIQIFIVIAVWTILKAQMMPDESTLLAEAQAQAEERYIRSAEQFERDHNCSMGDYMRGNVLHVDGMLSPAHIVSPDSNQRRPHFLNVDVLIRDVEEGTMVLYPVGTPVNFGSLDMYFTEDEDEDEDGLFGEGGNGTQVQFEHPDDVATALEVESIEGHLVPETQYQQGMSGLPGMGGALGQGPLGSALYPGQPQAFPNDPSSWQKSAGPLGPSYPNPGYPGAPTGVYPNMGVGRPGAQMPLGLNDMGLSNFGSSFQRGLPSQSAFGAAHGQAAPGIGTPGMGVQGIGAPGLGAQGVGAPGMGAAGMGPLSMGAPGMGPPGMGAPGLGATGMGAQGIGAAATPGSDALNHNLVLTKKPDGGYSLRFKPGGSDSGPGQEQPSAGLGPSPGMASGAAGAGPAGLAGAGQSWQSPTGPAGTLPSRKFGMHAGPSRFPFGQSTSGQPGQGGPVPGDQAGQAGQPSPGQASIGQPGSGGPAVNISGPASALSPAAAGSDAGIASPTVNISKPVEGDVTGDSSSKPGVAIDEMKKTETTDDSAKPGEDKKEEATSSDSAEGDKKPEEESVDKAPEPSSDAKPTGSESGEKALLADGVEERLKKFKTELFGKDQDDKGDDGSLTGQFKMNNPEICQKLDTIDILYVIASKPQSMDVRNRIRQGYVSPTVIENVKMAHVFVVGLTNSPNFQKNLDTEKERFNDIAMAEYMDAPENATLKAVSAMRWVKQYCPQAKHIMYVDEGFFVDTDKLVRGLIPTADKVAEQKYMLCPFVPSMPIPRQGPNAVKKPLFPTSTHFRPYCKSWAVLMSQPAMLSLLAASEQTPLFPAPDIYLFGVLPYIVGDLEIYDVGSKRAFHDFGQEVVACYEEKKDRCPLVASKASSSRFSQLLNLMKTRMQSTHDGWDGDNTVWDLKSFKRII